MKLATSIVQGIVTSAVKLGYLRGDQSDWWSDKVAPTGQDLAKGLNQFWYEVGKSHPANLAAYRIGHQLVIEQLGLLGMMLKNSQNLQEAWSCLDKFNILTSDFVQIDFSTREDKAKVQFQIDDVHELSAQAMSCFYWFEIGYSYAGIKQLLGNSFVLSYVCLPKSMKNSPEAKTLGLEVPVMFSDYDYAIGFDQSWLAAPVIFADPEERARLEFLIQSLYPGALQQANWTERVKTTIASLNQTGLPTVEQVAGAMAVSVRALQRKLAAEQTSFQQITDGYKLALATRYLKQQLPIAIIADKLGYSLPSAFTKAFKHWTGKTPSDYKLHYIQTSGVNGAALAIS